MKQKKKTPKQKTTQKTTQKQHKLTLTHSLNQPHSQKSDNLYNCVCVCVCF
jgi:N6-adenosine-specific RNA methylase IME4